MNTARDQTARTAIRTWMRRYARRFIDSNTGELNCTAMVEAWDRECADGAVTLDPDHDAWDIAVLVAVEVERR